MGTYRTVQYIKSFKPTHGVLAGEPIEHKVRRIVEDKEPITDGAPIIYTEKSDGVQPAYNVRTDRFELACEAMNQIHKNTLARTAPKGETAETAKSGSGNNNSNNGTLSE